MEDETRQPMAKDLYGTVAISSVWIVAGRWGSRGLGLVSTVILARLLAPEDFGLVAMATLIIGFAELLTHGGQHLAVVQKTDPDDDFINSAWTVTLLAGFFFGLIIVGLAPTMAQYFADPRVEMVMYVMSLRIFTLGFDNIGMVLFIKDFDFKKDFIINICEKVFPFSITLILALYYRNYWALVIGGLAGRAGIILITYYLHPYRPRLCFRKIPEVWSFSGWVLIESAGDYFTMMLDRFFIPSVGATSAMGYYHVGAELARMPVFELFMPLNRAFFPAYARLQHSPGEMMNNFVNILSVAAVICIPVCVGFAIVADDAVRFIYGEKWAPMIPVVSWISVNAGVLAIMSTFYPVLQASRNPRLAAMITFFHAMLLLAGLSLFHNAFNSITGIAMIRTLISFAVIPFAIFCLRRVIRVGFSQMFGAVWRPLLATGAMAAALLLLSPEIQGLAAGVSLALRIAAGTLTFTLVLGVSWLLAGRPAGSEQALSRMIVGRLGAKRALRE